MKSSTGKKQLRVLVVDDEALVCTALRMILSVDGHLVETAGSGEEGLVRFEHGEFDLVLTDYSMSGMKGTELAAAIKARSKNCPVVMVTALAQMLPSRLPFVDRILSKPFSREELCGAIDSLN